MTGWWWWMDYPFLNLLFSLVLFLSNGLSVGLYLLLSKENVGRSCWLLPLLVASLLPSIYIGFLLYRNSTPDALLQALLGLVVIVVLVGGAVLFLYGVPLSPVAQYIILAVLLLTILANFVLSYLLYHTMVADPIVYVDVNGFNGLAPQHR
jgi:hypothetical protein